MSRFIVAFLQIMGMTAYVAQGCTGSVYAELGDQGIQILGVPYTWWLYQPNGLQMQILCVDYLAGELFHTCFPPPLFWGWNCLGKTADRWSWNLNSKGQMKMMAEPCKGDRSEIKIAVRYASAFWRMYMQMVTSDKYLFREAYIFKYRKHGAHLE